MRIDKYLWTIRQYKTRSLAGEAVRKDKVKVNDEPAKASRNLKVNDLITVNREGINYTYKVLAFPPSRVGAKLLPDYMVEVTSAEEKEKAEFMGLMRKFGRRKGSGRPTKKERRDIDRLREGEEDETP